MLGRKVVHVGQRHGVLEEGVPADRIGHRAAEALLGFPIESTPHGSDFCIELRSHASVGIEARTHGRAQVVDEVERSSSGIEKSGAAPTDERGSGLTTFTNGTRARTTLYPKSMWKRSWRLVQHVPLLCRPRSSGLTPSTSAQKELVHPRVRGRLPLDRSLCVTHERPR